MATPVVLAGRVRRSRRRVPLAVRRPDILRTPCAEERPASPHRQQRSVNLPVLSISNAQGKKLSYLGADCEIPWDDLDNQKTRAVGHWVFLTLRSGLAVIVCINQPDEFIQGLAKDKTPDPQIFKVLYGPDVLHSDYTLYKAIFETTPRQITLLTPSNRAIGLMMVILLKAVMPPTTDWAIFNVHSQEFKGFQLGDPVRRPQKMCVKLISDDLHCKKSERTTCAVIGSMREVRRKGVAILAGHLQE